MKAAGLNPVLSANLSGASTPSGAMATMPAFENPVSSAAEVANKKATNKNLSEQNNLLRDQSAVAKAQAAKLKVDAASSAADIMRTNEDIKTKRLHNETLEMTPALLRGSNDPMSKGATILKSSAGAVKASYNAVKSKMSLSPSQHMKRFLINRGFFK